MHFGNWIIVTFLAFAVFIASLVFIAVKHDTRLVERNYYQKEQRHQQKMKRIKNANELSDPPKITFSGNKIQVIFSRFNRIDRGMLKLLRPSDPRLDRTFSLHPSQDTTQYFLLSNWHKGPYRVRMQWHMQGRDFYIEKMIVL